MSENKLPRVLLWSMSAVVILAIVAAVVISKANKSRAKIPVYGTVPQFEFMTQNGNPFGTPDLQGKITVLDFVFTHCQGPCPVMSLKMGQLYDQYADAKQVQFVSISVDPARDSLSVLRKYAKQQGVTDNRWVFLRGPINEVKRLSVDGFKLGAGDLPAGHSTRFVLIDGKGQIRGYYHGTDDASINVLKTHLNQLIKQSA